MQKKLWGAGEWQRNDIWRRQNRRHVNMLICYAQIGLLKFLLHASTYTINNELTSLSKL